MRRVQASILRRNGDEGGLENVGNIPGLGTMYTNNNLAPRIGFNIKLDNVGKTVLRGNWGVYFRQPITAEVSGIHPGLTPIITAFYDPATGG